MKVIFLLLMLAVLLPCFAEETTEPEKKTYPMPNEVSEGLFLIPMTIAFTFISIDAFAQARDIKTIPNYENNHKLVGQKNRKTYIGIASGLTAAGCFMYFIGKVHKNIKENPNFTITPNSLEICFNF
jgi:hypothetical protein